MTTTELFRKLRVITSEISWLDETMKKRLRQLAHALKPGVSRKTHLLLAALLWSAVGILLMFRGGNWLHEEELLVLFFPAIVVGSLKSVFILDKTAKRSIDRIRKLADGSCLGAVYSWKTWGLVLIMMTMGGILRNSAISPSVTGFLYVTIGWALFFSSRTGWRAWRESIR